MAPSSWAGLSFPMSTTLRIAAITLRVNRGGENARITTFGCLGFPHLFARLNIHIRRGPNSRRTHTSATFRFGDTKPGKWRILGLRGREPGLVRGKWHRGGRGRRGQRGRGGLFCGHRRVVDSGTVGPGRENGGLGTGGREAGLTTTVALFPLIAFPFCAGGANLGGDMDEVSRKGKGVAGGGVRNRGSGASVSSGCVARPQCFGN